MKTKYLIAILIVAALATASVVLLGHSQPAAAPAPSASADTADISTSTTPDGLDVKEAPPTISSLPPSAQQRIAPEPQAAATLGTASITVGTSTYPVAVSANETVEAAMQDLATSGEITYTYKNFAGMGAFVESINGKAGDNGHSWIFYVNGQESQTGISSTLLHPGDTVEWRYESDY